MNVTAITDYHAKYYAHQLIKRCPSNSVEKLASTLMDAQVDLNPHQIEAALFAFRSPLSRGAILADEVGLGKTIEAGIVLSQKWAERKRKILIIVPSSLRKQWHQELQDKFFLPSHILEARTFNMAQKKGARNPFDRKDIVICSYHFARSKAEFLTRVKWDLVVIDEAHRLRNVYKPSNKIARQLKEVLQGVPKILLTATPLQNSLLELYGLVSFVDDYAFGDLKSFRSQYARLADSDTYGELKARLTPVCKRTLRRQVLEYIRFTNRIPITQEFVPTKDEEVLYEMVSEYLRRENLQALPASQRSLMTLVLRKLLASSTFAIAGALDSLIRKLRARLQKNEKAMKEAEDKLSEDFESFEDLQDEWSESEPEQDPLSQEDIQAIEHEIQDLEAFRDLAVSITENAKGRSLLKALEIGLDKAAGLGAAKKAIIFTESRRTQDYLLRILGKTEYADRIVLFNGSNNDPKSKEIYTDWKQAHADTDQITGSRTADIRSALVDYFRNDAKIMIATEAAAEGINLQFCSLVVNYDLPWNPQRIEQRIGRCHRYGQKHDVVVVNFLNKKNAADQRVYQLLSEKFRLFSGVFGASDEVLGSIESGIDFEKRIVTIYQKCRTPDEIQASFDELQAEMSQEIDESMQMTRQNLLEHFDEEVHEKLRVNLKESAEYLNKHEKLLWELTRYLLNGNADFKPDRYEFMLRKIPFENLQVPLGPYEMGRHVEEAHIYRPSNPLAQRVIKTAIGKALKPCRIHFHYTDHPVKISILEPMVGKSGLLALDRFTVEALEVEDYLIFTAETDDGHPLDEERCKRLFSLPAHIQDANIGDGDEWEKLQTSRQNQEERILQEITEKNSNHFDSEMEKLDRWAEDLKQSLEIRLKQLDVDIKTRKTEAKKLLRLEEKIQAQREIKKLERMRNEMRMNLYKSQDDVDARKEALLNEIEARLRQRVQRETLFSIQWKIT